ncbi:hypothetical protein, partial [Enterobacter intestinihominis]
RGARDPYPYRRRRRRGDLTFLPGGSSLTRPKEPFAGTCIRIGDVLFNQFFGCVTFVINFVFVLGLL